MAWLDTLIAEWTQRLANGEKVPELNVYLHMPTATYTRWQIDRPAYVAGSDEVGYGALAGPLVVCAICAPYAWSLSSLKDSKAFVGKHADDRREEVAYELYALQAQNKIRISIIQVDAERIDELGVGTALRHAHISALEFVGSKIASLLKVADGSIDFPDDTISIPKADSFLPQVMAASIVAKHVRDNYMKDMAEKYPVYGFENHVGYGTAKHYEALKKHGPCALHRCSYNLKGKDSADAPKSRDGENV